VDVWEITGATVAGCSAADFCLNLPAPDDVVVWNADQMKISDLTGNTGNRNERFATLLMLRYENVDMKNVQLLDSNKDRVKVPGASGKMSDIQSTWRIFRSGTEALLAVLVQHKLGDKAHDDHKHAQRAFMAMTKFILDPTTRLRIDFPAKSKAPDSARNALLNVDKLEPEVLAYLAEYGDTDVAMLFRDRPMENQHADCKAPMIYVTNAQRDAGRPKSPR
jgi:hypothetical protein